jgi:hypothetical protein
VCEDILDHFKCYKLRAGSGFSRPQMDVSDQFESKNTQLMRASRFCNPVDKNGEGIIDSTAHIMCYQARDVPGQDRFDRKRVQITNQFGSQELNVVKTEAVCLPATKNLVAAQTAVSPFKCYQVTQQAGAHAFPKTDVTLTDQFETKTHTIIRPFLLCNPADVDDLPEQNPSCHLVCYKFKEVFGQANFVPEDVTIEDEINSGTVTALSAVCSRAALLCVPSLKAVIVP